MRLSGVCLFWVLVWFSGVVLAAPEDSTRVVFFELPPHGFVSKSRPQGAAVEYAKLIMKEMAKSFDIQQKPLARIIQNPYNDIVLYMGKSPVREKIFIFAETPLIEMKGVLVVLNETPIRELKSYADVGDKLVGVWAEGYRSPQFMAAKIKQFNFYGNDIIQRGLEVVKAKRIDAFYCPDAAAVHFVLNRHPELKRALRVVYLPEPATGLYTAFSKNLPPALIKSFEQAQKKVMLQMTYESYLAKYK